MSASINDEIAAGTFRRAEALRVAEATRWLTLVEVSELTRIPVRTLRSYVDAGKLPASHPIDGNSIRVRAGDVDRLFIPIEPKPAVKKGN